MSTNKQKVLAALLLTLFTTVHAEDCRDASAYETSAIDLSTNESTQLFDQLPTQCVETSMQLMKQWTKSLNRSSKPFVHCDPTSGILERSKTPLCLTEKLIANTQKLFVAVTDCLDIPAKALFPLINVESGFLPNAAAPNGEDSGIGQITPIAATDVNSRWLWLEAHVTGSTKSSCKALVPHLPTLKFDESLVENHICEFTRPEINPVRNILYAGYIFLLNTKYFNDLFLEQNLTNRLGILNGQSITTEQQNQVIHLLSILSYNKGFAWMREKFLMYLAREEAKLSFDIDDLLILANEIQTIEKQIQEAKEALIVQGIPELREVWRQKKLRYQELLNLRQHEYVLDFKVFHYRNFSTDSMIGFFKQQDSSRYIELVIERNDSIEDKFGVGTCSDFDHPRRSSALDHMIWL